MQSFDAILFPADGRPPHVVSLMTSPASFSNPHAPAQTGTARVPHPEVHMEYIAEDRNLRAWHYQVCEIIIIIPPLIVRLIVGGGISTGLLQLKLTASFNIRTPGVLQPVVRRGARHDE